MKRRTVEERTELYKRMYEYLKSKKGENVTRQEMIDELEAPIYDYNMATFLRLYPDVQSVKGHGYFYTGKEEPDTEVKDKIESFPKISYASRGKVYSTFRHNAYDEYFLILSEYGEKVIGIPLYPDQEVSMGYPIVVSGIPGRILYGDATCVRSKPTKHLKDFIGNVEDSNLIEMILLAYFPRIFGMDLNKYVEDHMPPEKSVDDYPEYQRLCALLKSQEEEIAKLKEGSEVSYIVIKGTKYEAEDIAYIIGQNVVYDHLVDHLIN